MADEGSRLTPLGKIISIVLILGLVGVGVWLVMRQGVGGKPGGGLFSQAPETEAPDTAGVTTVKEYKYVPADRLPPVKGVSQYVWDPNEKILNFTYNVWAGWLPVIAANGGTKPNADSIFAKKYGFRVRMDLMDDPVAARDAFAAGKVHTLWGTADMIVLMAPELVKDSRTAPRVVQQIDWSNGGDGIVVRSAIKSVADLRGKTITLAQNSPSEYYLTSLLLSAGMSPKDVRPKFTATAFEAAAAFVADKKVDACVSWAPDIYNIPERVAGTRILSSTQDANKLIADVYAIRADFVRDHPEIVEGLVAGIFEGMDVIKDKPEQACKWMADAFGMKPEDIMGMRNDFHSTNFEENRQFFINSSNPTNFERTWKSAHQKDESVATFTPSSFRKTQAEAPILTQTIRINFFPNSANPYEPARDEYNNLIQGKLYDPNVGATLERVAQLAGQFARAVILIEGHADSSMKGRVPVDAVLQLSRERAEAIKRALIDKFKFDPNKFIVQGKGWDTPADPGDPNNQALNRRVEISVFPPEQK
jgi:NitT/TauT family transport system substrate-binding protein